MERGGREGRVYGPLLVKPCLVVIVEDLSMEKGMIILVKMAPKGLWKEWKFLWFNLERVMIGMVLTSLIGKIHLPPKQDPMDGSIVINQDGCMMNCVLVIVLYCLGSALFSLVVHEELKLKG